MYETDTVRFIPLVIPPGQYVATAYYGPADGQQHAVVVDKKGADHPQTIYCLGWVGPDITTPTGSPGGLYRVCNRIAKRGYNGPCLLWVPR